LVALTLITLLGLALRLPSLGNSLFGDELSTYSIVTGHGPGQILHLLDGHSVDLTPPLYFELTWLVSRLGRGPELLRAVSLLAGLAAIPLTYELGVLTVGRRTALAGSLLVALSPFLIFFSTEARAYALLMALALASTVALLRGLQSNRLGWWVAYAALSAAAMYCHYTAVFVLAVQLIWALVTHRARARALLGANLAAALAFAPWLPVLAKNRHSFGTRVFEIVDPFSLHAVLRDTAHWAVGHPYLSLGSEPGRLALGLIAVALVAGLVAIAWARRTGPSAATDPTSSAWLLPLLLAVATPAGLAVYSALGQSAWDERNLIASWPGLALTAATLVTAARAPLRHVLTGLLCLGFAIGAGSMLSSSRQRPDYAAAASYILGYGSSQDPVAVIPAPTPGPYTAMDASFAYAGAPGRPLLRIGSAQLAAVLAAPPYAFLPQTPAATLAARTEASTGDGRVFVVAPGTAAVAALLRSGAVNAPRVLGPIFGTGTSGRLYSTVFVPLSAYLRAIARRYALVTTRRLPGFLALSVYVFAVRR
jgi:hypothetical protein